jgi:hypothetical protein
MNVNEKNMLIDSIRFFQKEITEAEMVESRRLNQDPEEFRISMRGQDMALEAMRRLRDNESSPDEIMEWVKSMSLCATSDEDTAVVEFVKTVIPTVIEAYNQSMRRRSGTL